MKTKKKHLILCGLAICPFVQTQAQSLERTSVNSGGSLHSANISLGYSIGESAVANHTGTTVHLTEGFQQGTYISFNSIGEHQVEGRIYPVPTGDLLYVDMQRAKSYNLIIFDVNGRLVRQQDLNTQSTAINCSDLETGVYILQITDKGSHQTTQFKFNKL